MAISSGRCRIPVMHHPKEFFDIGQPFRYTPLSDKSLEMILVPMECKDLVGDSGRWCIGDCQDHCVLSDYCNSSKNIDPISGETFIPACSVLTRADHANAYFEEYYKNY